MLMFLITVFSWDQLAAWMPIAMFLCHREAELLSAKRTKEGLKQGASVFMYRDWQAEVKTSPLLPFCFLTQ